MESPPANEQRPITEAPLTNDARQPATASESFYSGALDRIRRFMIVVAIAATLVALAWLGWRQALGLAVGCAIAYLNFHWLKGVVSGMADRITLTGQRQSGRGIVLRFLLRYVLMGLAAYAIFSVSPASLYGLLTGLFLPVAAIACEAGYELYATVAREL
jgi:small-conductance mechanosensitive channel